jgi:NADH-quinone oxidoreductase subunit L
MAIQQDDIKRILAYSTLSQLGYMVMAVGVHGPTEGMFHLTTHAFFKALLFLGAGSVIHALANEQDIWKMGGLRKKLPVTFWTFMAGTLALCGVVPFSGFYSKDALLAKALENNKPLFVLGVLVAVLTTFYMFRLVFVVFFGNGKSGAVDHAHESPPVMAWPLRVLAVFSIIGGLIGIDQIVARQFPHAGEHHAATGLAMVFAPFGHAPVAAFSSLCAVIVGFLLARAFYLNTDKDPLPSLLGGFAKLCRNKFYFDEMYEWFIQSTQELLAKLAEWFDRWIVAGFAVRGASGATDIFGRMLRLVQTGNLQTYAFLFVLGVAAVLWFMLGK